MKYLMLSFAIIFMALNGCGGGGGGGGGGDDKKQPPKDDCKVIEKNVQEDKRRDDFFNALKRTEFIKSLQETVALCPEILKLPRELECDIDGKKYYAETYMRKCKIPTWENDQVSEFQELANADPKSDKDCAEVLSNYNAIFPYLEDFGKMENFVQHKRGLCAALKKFDMPNIRCKYNAPDGKTIWLFKPKLLKDLVCT